MGFCSVCLPPSGLADPLRPSRFPSAFPATCTYTARSTVGSPRSLLAPQSATLRFRRPSCVTQQTKFGPAGGSIEATELNRSNAKFTSFATQTACYAAWAVQAQTAASSSFDVEDQPEDNSTFKQLCHSQLKLVCTVLGQAAVLRGTRTTVYRRNPATFDAGQLQLSKVSSYTDLDSHHLPDDLDGTLFLGLVGSGAEKALAEAQLVDLPNTGAFVLPLAAHGFLVGLLVLEQVARPPEQASCTNIRQSGQIAGSSSSAGMQADGGCVLLGDKDREVVRLAGQVLAAACAMDLHSALQTAQASMHSQQVIGLVEEVRGPLTALRTLGSILVPRLVKKEGQEINRDVAQGILTQGDRLQEVVSQLQAAIHPAALPPGLGSLRQSAIGKLATSNTAPKRLRNKRKQAQPLLPSVKQDSSADDQLHK